MQTIFLRVLQKFCRPVWAEKRFCDIFTIFYQAIGFGSYFLRFCEEFEGYVWLIFGLCKDLRRKLSDEPGSRNQNQFNYPAIALESRSSALIPTHLRVVIQQQPETLAPSDVDIAIEPK